MYLHGTAKINPDGNLEIGSCDTTQLVKQFGSPLYVMDETNIRNQMRRLKSACEQTSIPYRVAYASKAFNTLAMCRIVEEEGYLLDVVSGGELYTAIQAGFPAERIYFHGNNKSTEELREAINHGVKYIVVDNMVELTMLEDLASEMGKIVPILFRITPGVEAHTHNFVQTGQEDSKFGFDLSSGQANQAVQYVLGSSSLLLKGFHSHIGSQIFDADAFAVAINRLVELIHECHKEYAFFPTVLNIGGGFGIRYTEQDTPRSIEEIIQGITAIIEKAFPERCPEIWLEPGRWIVGESGTTLYTVGTMKEIPGVRKYVAVDGGIADNPRPALYDAKYEAMLANRANEEETELVSIAGKCCESGDMLIWDVHLPPVKKGDILAISCTGAYNYSMASNYNRLPKPAVVLVQNGRAEMIVERETYADILKKDKIPSRLLKQTVNPV
ncbi:diaminopimelate decarboxylase [Shimazuella sp. AN120528]|uniref:diaminopimelate decarboxylase n=1 Tax=Shimazuella soli TaxID=1892854 RepID=UPI001F0F0B51|nr:diaminopimelate decarboxylase [Shimazuella soli]MCH5584270.1 diaminopimelate decarboxylase [Shimazuella soli]